MAEKLADKSDLNEMSEAPSPFDLPEGNLHEIVDNVDPINRSDSPTLPDSSVGVNELAIKLDSMKMSESYKTIGVKYTKSVADMPDVVCRGIVDYSFPGLNPSARIFLAHISSELKNVISSKNIGIKKCEMSLYLGRFHLRIKDETIKYDSDKNGCRVGGSVPTKWNLSVEKSPLDALLDDLSIILENKKLRLDEFVVVGADFLSTEQWKQLVEILNICYNSAGPFNAKEINITTVGAEKMIDLIARFKPGILEKNRNCLALYAIKFFN